MLLACHAARMPHASACPGQADHSAAQESLAYTRGAFSCLRWALAEASPKSTRPSFRYSSTSARLELCIPPNRCCLWDKWSELRDNQQIPRAARSSIRRHSAIARNTSSCAHAPRMQPCCYAFSSLCVFLRLGRTLDRLATDDGLGLGTVAPGTGSAVADKLATRGERVSHGLLRTDASRQLLRCETVRLTM